MSAYATPYADCLRGGFSVSIAQYMPTLWLGAGRFRRSPLTEAVALSSGGSNGIFAAQALWQLLLPLIIFALTALVAKWVGYVDKDSANALRENVSLRLPESRLLTNVNFTVDKVTLSR